MGGSDSIASHVFEHSQLVTERVFMNRCTERTEVVVEADTFELTGLTV